MPAKCEKLNAHTTLGQWQDCKKDRAPLRLFTKRQTKVEDAFQFPSRKVCSLKLKKSARTIWVHRKGVRLANIQDSNDSHDLEHLGYAQELLRDMGGFSSFAVSFSVISILTG